MKKTNKLGLVLVLIIILIFLFFTLVDRLLNINSVTTSDIYTNHAIEDAVWYNGIKLIIIGYCVFDGLKYIYDYYSNVYHSKDKGISPEERSNTLRILSLPLNEISEIDCGLINIDILRQEYNKQIRSQSIVDAIKQINSEDKVRSWYPLSKLLFNNQIYQ